MEAVILLGAPGAGKGTVADVLKDATGYLHLSTGDMLREAVKAGRSVGLEAKSFMEKGELVPDEVIMKIVTERLEADPEDTGYVFDGFPRTLEQATLLDRVFEQLDARLLHVFLLEVPQDVLVSRLANRRICRDCGAVYHVINIPPKVEGVCDECGGELYQRPDDAEETVLNRLDVFRRQTESLIDYYQDKGLLVTVNGAAGKDETVAQIVSVLNAAAGD